MTEHDSYSSTVTGVRADRHVRSVGGCLRGPRSINLNRRALYNQQSLCKRSTPVASIDTEHGPSRVSSCQFGR